MSILNTYINQKLIFLDVEVSTQEELLNNMARELNQSGNVNEFFIEGVVKREKEFPTGLQIEDIGVALPHTDIEYVNSPAIAMAVLKEPIGFYSMENNDDVIPVNIVFMLAINDGDQQLELLQEITSLIQSKTKMKNIVEADTKDEILRNLKL